MHTKQTVAFGKEQREKWLKFNKGEFTVTRLQRLMGRGFGCGSKLLVLMVNMKIGGKWMFIHPNMEP